MKESTKDCIINCLNTELGSHVLYRNFGLAEVDTMNAPMTKDIVVQLSTYYPEVSLNELTVNQVNGDGGFYYTVDLKSNED